ncbi:hypothetical protein AAVH_23602 [Aphelenchoides avenae]|nr:hypothetical protein AAVH_23602 [Aphelenchus avenae]
MRCCCVVLCTIVAIVVLVGCFGIVLVIMKNRHNACGDASAKDTCAKLLDVIDGKGPFAKCKMIGKEKIQKQHDACLEKLCKPSNDASTLAVVDFVTLRCQAIDDFARACATLVQGFICSA